MPWVVRNKVSVGCFTLTTDTRALWKANNLNTYDTLAQGKWIDDVPPLPNEPPTPEFAGAYYKVYGKVLPVDECARMRFYRHLVFQFWRDHPGEKAKLAGQASWMLWDPQAIRTEGRAESGGAVDTLREWVQPAYSIAIFVLGILGVWLLPGRLALLGVVLLAYQTLVAMGFAGATRYRVPWDFLIALARLRPAAVDRGRWADRRTRCEERRRASREGRPPPPDPGNRRVRAASAHAAAGARGRGVEPVFLGLDDPGWAVEPFYRELGVEAVRLPCPRDIDPVLLRRVRRELARLRPDIVHTHLVHGDVYGGLGAGAVPVVSTKHNDDPFRRGPFRHVERLLTRRARRVIAISRRCAGTASTRSGCRRRRSRSSTTGSTTCRRPGATGPDVSLPDDARILLCVSRLAEQKGVDVAVRALARVREIEPRAVLVVLGEGPGARAARPARRRVPAGARRRRRVVVPPRRAARPPGALGGLRACAARGDAGGEAGGGDARERRAGDRRRRRDGRARAAGRRRTRWPRPCSALLADPARAAAMGEAGLARARSEFSVARMAERTARRLRAARSAPERP